MCCGFDTKNANFIDEQGVGNPEGDCRFQTDLFVVSLKIDPEGRVPRTG